MLHQFLVEARALRDWEINVAIGTGPAYDYEFDGIPVKRVFDRKELLAAFRQADAAMTHLMMTRTAMNCAKRCRTPLIHMVHNDQSWPLYKPQPETCSLAIANSEWIRDTLPRDVPAVVLYPSTPAERYATTPGDAVTLVNLVTNKGPHVLYELARRFPEQQFLAVAGGYGNQLLPPPGLPNVELVENTPNMLDVYGRTRVLLVPSEYESWGRVAVEAACSGIPVLATPTPGLRETGVCAAHIDRDDIDQWEVELRRLLVDDKWYREAGERGKARAHDITKMVAAQMVDVCAAVEAVVE